ncbi:MAG TPA: DNA mismatch repair protein MutS, partial [Firmicutes bacterium]|nr:DNA mismatch repair protein MutS [Bacillota bacterium]
AQSYQAGYFSIVTSINKDDFLPGGKSYFLVEAEAILAMIRKAERSHVVALCIIDELFRGTNSAERIPAAIEVLKYFADKNILCVIATHDLEVAESCSHIYTLYHFSERVGALGLEFDYKLHKGIATSRNAIRVLEYLGYPETIVKRAWEKAEGRQGRAAATKQNYHEKK